MTTVLLIVAIWVLLNALVATLFFWPKERRS